MAMEAEIKQLAETKTIRVIEQIDSMFESKGTELVASIRARRPQNVFP